MNTINISKETATSNLVNAIDGVYGDYNVTRSTNGYGIAGDTFSGSIISNEEENTIFIIWANDEANEYFYGFIDDINGGDGAIVQLMMRHDELAKNYSD